VAHVGWLAFNWYRLLIMVGGISGVGGDFTQSNPVYLG